MYLWQCFDDYRVADGIECSAMLNGSNGNAAAAAAAAAEERNVSHFMCDDCFSGHVRAATDDEGLRLFRERGGVCCPDPSCTSQPFSDKALAASLSDDQFAAYARAKEKLAETRIAAQLEAEYAERMNRQIAELKQRAGGDVAEELRAYVIEQIFSLACPRCGQVFMDFDGCFALTCSRPDCGCGFCAKCLKDCGKDAHGHVGRCDMYGARGFHGDFDKVQKVRRTALFKEFLQKLPPAAATRLTEDCARDVEDLGLGTHFDFAGIHGKQDADPREAMRTFKENSKGGRGRGVSRH